MLLMPVAFFLEHLLWFYFNWKFLFDLISIHPNTIYEGHEGLKWDVEVYFFELEKWDLLH